MGGSNILRNMWELKSGNVIDCIIDITVDVVLQLVLYDVDQVNCLLW